MSRDDPIIINFDDPQQKVRWMTHLGTLRGVYRCKLDRVRNQRSLSQNAFLHGVVFPYVAKGLRDVSGNDLIEVGGVKVSIDSYAAKELCKEMFLKVPLVNKRSGELIGYFIRHTSSLNTEECAVFIDKVCAWAADYLGVTIPPPTKFYTEPEAA